MILASKKLMIRPGLVDDLRSRMRSFTVEDVVVACDSIFVRNTVLYAKNHRAFTLDDVLVYEGRMTKARDSIRYWFRAGPPENEALIYGTLLDWFINTVLLRLTMSGGTWSVESATGIKIT